MKQRREGNQERMYCQTCYYCEQLQFNPLKNSEPVENTLLRVTRPGMLQNRDSHSRGGLPLDHLSFTTFVFHAYGKKKLRASEKTLRQRDVDTDHGDLDQNTL